MRQVKIGICQMAVEADKTTNIEKAGAMIQNAARNGCILAVLPEMFNCPYQADLFPRYAERYPGETAEALSKMAASHGLILVGGSIPEEEAGRVYNTSFVFGPHGELLGRHRKVHLFDVAIQGGTVFRESDSLTAGREITVIRTEKAALGIGVCYDMRFPEMARTMVLRGAEILIYPAAFGPTTGPAHWELILRNRAVDNQVFVIGAAPAFNPLADYQAYGHSLVADPWGRIVAEAGQEETLLLVEIDLDYITRVRQELPLLQHRHPELY
ncbi:carbon-nitrogen hydrolase [Lucifera butyrica]|uniref:Carbon-nitrogen hydrolase n=1 Tax=Lucifera butyrica TaxID=1351585 RepID=A0A498QYQ9_9FIRM|nr:carbon-nitrogen hydrolase family protein [Lucifera butyrica]VBB05326.1 carbon-nitrogen hydrolase [Lucifera butyrica]